LLNLPVGRVDEICMDASAYAFVRGIRATKAALRTWNRRPGPILRTWLLGSFVAAAGLLAAVWAIATIASPGPGFVSLQQPPIVVGDWADVLRILYHNALVLALHAMACLAGFIAGSALPAQAPQQRNRVMRRIHERGGRLAILFVVGATAFSLSAQAYVLGTSVARVAFALQCSPANLLLGLLPHALPELMALFLPLAAWIIASRRGQWDELLAATFVTVVIAVPVLVMTALWEVYIAPHVLSALIGY
jgi:hypothetical protein